MDDATLLISIEYMRCVRRMQGRDEARKAFMRVRKAPGKRWETFVAAALLEWRYDKNDKVARNVFELGLKSFISQPAYVAQYADFLVGCNDVANARVLFERATAAAGEASAAAAGLGGTDKEGKAAAEKEFWDMFVAFEHAHGTMETMTGVERRRREAVRGPDAVDTSVFAEKLAVELPVAVSLSSTEIVFEVPFGVTTSSWPSRLRSANATP